MLIIILGAAALCSILLILFVRKARLRTGWLIVALVTAAAACAFTAAGLQKGVVFARYASAPEDTVSAFFDSIQAGDYGAACAQLDNYADLGMDREPEDAAAALIYDALHASYACKLLDGGQTEGLSAVREVSFTALDAAALQNALRDEVLANLARYVDERPYSDIYDENDQYRTEVTEEAYLEAVSTLLDRHEDFLRTETLSLSLRYDERGWHLTADAALLSALNGYLTR